jgi:hypothetical protein
MKVLKKIAIGLAVIIVLLLVISFFLPSNIHVERSLEIKASPDTVYGMVADLKKWGQWSPWHKMDPNIVITYGEKTEGLGASYSWTSDHSDVGNGRMVISEAVPGEKIKLEMYFMESKDPAFGGWIFEKTNEGVKATNTMDMNAGMNPVMRIMGLMMDSMVGEHFEDGLNNLKQIAEAK